MKGRGIMAAAQKKPAGTAKTTAPKTSIAAKKYKKSIVIKASRSKVIAHNDGSKDK